LDSIREREESDGEMAGKPAQPGGVRAPRGIGLKVQKKSSSGHGAYAAGAASHMTNANATIYDKDMRRAFA
jgi:hypothetical protein